VRVTDAVLAVLQDTTDRSTVSTTTLINKVRAHVATRCPGGQVPLPSGRTLRRLVEHYDLRGLARGKATTRRSAAARPNRGPRPVTVMYPGQIAEIDSTPVNVLCLMPDDSIGRPSLTAILDIATHSLLGFSMVPTGASGVEHADLLARILRPRRTAVSRGVLIGEHPPQPPAVGVHITRGQLRHPDGGPPIPPGRQTRIRRREIVDPRPGSLPGTHRAAGPGPCPPRRRLLPGMTAPPQPPHQPRRRHRRSRRRPAPIQRRMPLRRQKRRHHRQRTIPGRQRPHPQSPGRSSPPTPTTTPTPTTRWPNPPGAQRPRPELDRPPAPTTITHTPRPTLRHEPDSRKVIKP